MALFSRGLTAAIVAPVLCLPAFAHHPGSGGNGGDAGPINTISATTIEQGHFAVGVTVDYSSLNTVSDAKLLAARAADIDGVHGLKTVQSYALNLAYGVTNDFTIAVRVPYVRRTEIREAEDDGLGGIAVFDHGPTSGIGDVSVLGQYRVFNDQARRLEVALLAGFIAPTGVNGRFTKQGEIFDAEFQPGSGAWSGLFGVALTKRVGQWSFDTNVLYVKTGGGTQSTNLGDLVFYNAAASYRWLGIGTHRHGGPMYHGGVPHDHAPEPGGPALDLVLELNGEWSDKQKTAGIIDDQSGGSVILISPGLRLSQGPWSGFVSVGVPVARDLNGTQAEPDWRIRTGVGVTF